MRRLLVTALAMVLAVAPPTLEAQERPGPAQRDSLRQDARAALARRVQQVLGASDDQMRRLEPINRKFDAERRALMLEERGVRGELRQALRAATPDESRVGKLLDSLFTFQQRRLDLVEQEQRELAAVLTPSQRARYLVLQEEVRRRAEGVREQRGRRGRGRP